MFSSHGPYNFMPHRVRGMFILKLKMEELKCYTKCLESKSNFIYLKKSVALGIVMEVVVTVLVWCYT